MGISNLERRIARAAAIDAAEVFEVDVENRKLERKPCFKDAVVEGDNGLNTECIIKNTSENGALLSLPMGIILPTEIRICFPEIELELGAAVRWQDGNRAGIELLG